MNGCYGDRLLDNISLHFALMKLMFIQPNHEHVVLNVTSS